MGVKRRRKKRRELKPVLSRSSCVTESSRLLGLTGAFSWCPVLLPVLTSPSSPSFLIFFLSSSFPRRSALPFPSPPVLSLVHLLPVVLIWLMYGIVSTVGGHALASWEPRPLTGSFCVALHRVLMEFSLLWWS